MSECFMRGSLTSSSFLAGRMAEVDRGSRRDTKVVRVIALVCSCSIFAVRLSMLEENQCGQCGLDAVCPMTSFAPNFSSINQTISVMQHLREAAFFSRHSLFPNTSIACASLKALLCHDSRVPMVLWPSMDNKSLGSVEEQYLSRSSCIIS